MISKLRNSNDLSAGVMSPVTNEEVKRKYKAAIAQFFLHNRRRNAAYGAKFVTCELLNIVNCAAQIVLIDTMLAGEFTTYGLQGGLEYYCVKIFIYYLIYFQC